MFRASKLWILVLALFLSSCGGSPSGGTSLTPPGDVASSGRLQPNVRLLSDSENMSIIKQGVDLLQVTAENAVETGQVLLAADDAYLVQSIVSNDGDVTVFKYVTPSIDQVFSELGVVGTHAGVLDSASPNSGGRTKALRNSPQSLTAGFSAPGVTGSMTIDSKVSATLDYEFSLSKGGLVKSDLELINVTTLSVNASLEKDIPFRVDVPLGRVAIPIPLKLFSSASEYLGLNLVSLDIVFSSDVDGKVGAKLSNQLKTQQTASFSVKYDSGSLLVDGTTTGTTDYVADPDVSDQESGAALTGEIEVTPKVGPKLSFLNSLALLEASVYSRLKVDADIGVKSEDSPPFCIKSALVGTFGGDAVAKFGKGGETATLSARLESEPVFSAVLDPVGSCKAPVVLTVSPLYATAGKPSEIKVRAALDLGRSAFLSELPKLPPSGTVSFLVVDAVCEAHLTPISDSVSEGSCSINVPDAQQASIDAEYVGDDVYDGAKVQKSFDILGILGLRFVSSLTLSRDGFCPIYGIQDVIATKDNFISAATESPVIGCDVGYGGFYANCYFAPSTLYCEHVENYGEPDPTIFGATWNIAMQDVTGKPSTTIINVIQNSASGGPSVTLDTDGRTLMLRWDSKSIRVFGSFQIDLTLSTVGTTQ